MAKYRHGTNYTKSQRQSRRGLAIVAAFIVAGLAALLVVLADSWLSSGDSTRSEVSDPILTTISPSIEVFTSPYFQFQTDKNWRFVTDESSDTKYVYHRYENSLVEAIMTIYVNEQPKKTQATRVLTVRPVVENFILRADAISEHCRNVLPEDERENVGDMQVTFSTVDFLCDTDGNVFTVVVGREDATSELELPRPDGTTATYMIYFEDVRFVVEPDEFVDIMNTFQVR